MTVIETRESSEDSTVPFHRVDFDVDDIAAVIDVLRSGWLTTGPQTQQFEASFAERIGHGVRALAVSSGTAALHLALEAAGVVPGDCVLTSTYTFTATAAVVEHLGARPILCDVDAHTGNLTVATVEAALGRLDEAERAAVKALVPVHFAGLPCDLTSLVGLASEHDWYVVSDAAHALPARHAGRDVGAWGDATAFSFYATKTLPTGEGGMVVTRRPSFARRIETMRLHGMDRDSFDRYRSANGWRYRIVAPGFKYNMPDLTAVLGLCGLPRLDEQLRSRESIARRYDEAFAGIPGLATPAEAPPGDQHARHLYPLRVEAGERARDALIEELDQRGVRTSVHFIPLHLHPYYQERYELSAADFPAATRFYRQEVSLPLYPTMTPSQVDQVISAVAEGMATSRGPGARTAHAIGGRR